MDHSKYICTCTCVFFSNLHEESKEDPFALKPHHKLCEVFEAVTGTTC